MLNRLRLRAQHEASERGDEDKARFDANAALLQQGHGVNLVVGARFPITPGGFPQGQPTTVVRMPMHFKPQNQQMHPLPRAAAASAQPSLPGSPSGLRPVEAASPALRVSPRLRPVKSPELRSTRPVIDLDDDIDDDDVMSFPGSDLDSTFDGSDEHDDVYADFGAIFGGGAASDGEGSDEDGDNYDELMDDLDGIPWSVR